MALFQTLLLPLDGSEFAESAIPYAVELTRLTGATLVVLQVLPEPAPIFDRSRHETIWLTQPDLRLDLPRPEPLEPVLTRLEEQGMHPRTVIRLGEAAREIVAEAERWPESAIVMASHGRGGWSRMTLGSVATAVIAGTTLPVLVARPGPDQPERVTVRRLAVLLDGSAESEAALEPATSLARAAAGGLRLVRVVATHDHHEPGDASVDTAGITARTRARVQREGEAAGYLAALALRLRESGVRAGWEMLSGDPTRELPDYLRRDQPDLAVMATHGRGRLGRWLVGSMADHLLTSCDTPLLLTRVASAT